MYAIVHEHVYYVTGNFEIKGDIRLCRSDGEIKKYFSTFRSTRSKKIWSGAHFVRAGGLRETGFFLRLA